MASIHREMILDAGAAEVWDALRDFGALHERLAPGFVVDTRLEPGARVVTFFNGAVVRELLVTCDDERRRLVWSAAGGLTDHYNAAAQVFDAPGVAPFSSGPWTCCRTTSHRPSAPRWIMGSRPFKRPSERRPHRRCSSVRPAAPRPRRRRLPGTPATPAR